MDAQSHQAMQNWKHQSRILLAQETCIHTASTLQNDELWFVNWNETEQEKRPNPRVVTSQEVSSAELRQAAFLDSLAVGPGTGGPTIGSCFVGAEIFAVCFEFASGLSMYPLHHKRLPLWTSVSISCFIDSLSSQALPLYAVADPYRSFCLLRTFDVFSRRD